MGLMIRAGARKRDRLSMVAAGLPSSLVRPEVVAASAKAVAELLSCCMLGILAAKRGILTPVNVGALSKVNTAPASLGCNKGETNFH